MSKKLIFILFLILASALTACNKPMSNPESLDPIYADLNKEVASVDQLLQQEMAILEKAENELKAVVPQTGQIKFAQKRVTESKYIVERLNQHKTYYMIKAQSRLEHARRDYLKAFYAGKEWPDPKELELYKIQKRFETASKQWNHDQRRDQFKASLALDNKAAPETTPKK